MSERPISPLRQRKFGEKTRRAYIRHVETFASFLGRSPDTGHDQPTACPARSRVGGEHRT